MASGRTVSRRRSGPGLTRAISCPRRGDSKRRQAHRCGQRRPSRVGRTWNWFEVSTLPSKKCELRYQNSALHNANVDTNRKESHDVWLAQEELRVRSGYDVSVRVERQENSEKTKVQPCRKALDLGRYTWANSVPSGDRWKSAT